MALATDTGDGIKTSLSVTWAETRAVVPIVGYGYEHATQVMRLSLSADGGTTPISFAHLKYAITTNAGHGTAGGATNDYMILTDSGRTRRTSFMQFLHMPSVSIKRNLDTRAYSGIGATPNDQAMDLINAEASATTVNNAKVVYSGGAVFSTGEKLAALDVNTVEAGETATAGAADATISVGWDNSQSYSLVQIIGSGFSDATEHTEMECSANGGSSYLTLFDQGTWTIGIAQPIDKLNDVSKFRLTAGTSARQARETASFVVSIPYPHGTNFYKRIFSVLGGYNTADTRMQAGGQCGATNPAATDTINHVRFSMSGGANIATGAHVQVLLWP